MKEAILTFLQETGVYKLIKDAEAWKYLLMYVIIGALFYLAIVKKFEPLLLLPIAFGMLLANLPGADLIHTDFFFDDYYINVDTAGNLSGVLADRMSQFLAALKDNGLNYEIVAASDTGAGKILFDASLFKNADFLEQFNLYLGDTMKLDADNLQVKVRMATMIGTVIDKGNLLDFLYLGVKLGIYPSLIFLGVGAMTDFTPLIANPKSLFIGAGAQFGVFVAFFAAIMFGFTPMQAGAIGIIGGADGPTAILVTKSLAPELLGAIAIAAYSYMALIPIIQPPFMKLLTTEKERKIKMTNLRSVTTVEKVVFPILVTFIVTMIVPSAAPLVGFLMLGNLFNVSGVTERLSKTAQNELCNIVTICLGVSVGATANAKNFIDPQTLYIIVLGLCAFAVSTMGGLITAKIMCKLTGGKINPLIGSAGVSAVPMAARVSQDVGRRYDPSNFLLMHAMGPNVAGVIGSAVAAGVFLAFFQ